MTNQTPKIECRNVHKSFGDNHVLKGIDLKVMPGERFVIIGGSGSGKSVLLRCILGLMSPNQGQIMVDGENTVGLSERNHYKLLQKFGMLFQNGALFDSMSVWENIGFGLLEQGQKRQYVKDLAISKLEQVGLKPEVADQMPADLSGGMKKRVALARAISLEPEIIFYDEPTTGLDPITTDTINNLIMKLSEELGITSVIITHNMGSAYKIADHMAMLYHGQLIFTGTPDEISKTDNEYVQQFITGSSEGPIQALNFGAKKT